MTKKEKMELAALMRQWPKLSTRERQRLSYLENVRDESMAPKNP